MTAKHRLAQLEGVLKCPKCEANADVVAEVRARIGAGLLDPDDIFAEAATVLGLSYERGSARVRPGGPDAC